MDTESVQLTPLELRQAEVAQYETNIALYESILTSLPTEWPSHLEKYRGAKNQHESAAEVSNLADVELLSKLWYVDECKKAIRAETVELTKAKSILAVLQA
jgi:hypothetical protein